MPKTVSRPSPKSNEQNTQTPVESDQTLDISTVKKLQSIFNVLETGRSKSPTQISRETTIHPVTVTRLMELAIWMQRRPFKLHKVITGTNSVLYGKGRRRQVPIHEDAVTE